MNSFRNNPDGPENEAATRQNDREVFALKMQAKADDWRSLSVTAIAAENESVAEYVEQLERDNQRLTEQVTELRKSHERLRWVQSEKGQIWMWVMRTTGNTNITDEAIDTAAAKP